MKNVLRNRVVIALVLASLVFWTLAPFVPRTFLFYSLNSVAVAVLSGVAIAYLPGLKNALTMEPGRMRTGHILIFGTVLISFAFAMRLAWLAIWRWSGEPNQWPDHLFLAWLVLIGIIGALLQLFSANAIEGHIPRRSAVIGGTLVGVGILFGAFTYALMG